MKTTIIVAVLLMVLSSCAMTLPVVVIGKDGHVLKGTATAAMNGGSFSATDGKLTCGGNYDDWSMAHTLTMQVLCSDGRKGIVIATRDAGPGGGSGHGTVHLNDGSEWTFVFGPAAANF
jgi:hypothetical protein